MGHYTVPRAQLVAHLHQHELERWVIRRGGFVKSWSHANNQAEVEEAERTYERFHPQPKMNDHKARKRATLEALHEAFHEQHGHEVNHTHPHGYSFLHFIFEDAPDGIPIYLQRGVTP